MVHQGVQFLRLCQIEQIHLYEIECKNVKTTIDAFLFVCYNRVQTTSPPISARLCLSLPGWESQRATFLDVLPLFLHLPFLIAVAVTNQLFLEEEK